MTLPNQVQLAFCTTPDRDSAERIARVLVEERLAACVGILPGLRSVYRWKDAVEQADELQLSIKTTSAQWDALCQRVRQLHPYELPELIAVDVAAGLPPYLQWVVDSTVRVD